jgi:hypothetical protein
MNDEESTSEARPAPPANGAHSGARLLELIDRRIQAHLGKSGRTYPSDGEDLLKALDEYLQVREALARKKDEAEIRPTRRDVFWLCTMAAGILLLGMLIPDSVFEKIRYKEYGENVLMVLATVGLVGKWARSPKDLIHRSRTRKFRWLAASSLAIGALLVLNVVTVHVTVDPPDTEVYLDDAKDQLRAHEFGARLKGLEVRLVKAEANGEPRRERALTISLFDLLSNARLTGTGLRVEQTWRMDYDVGVECLEGYCYTPVTFSFALDGAEFDDRFTTYLTDNKLHWQQHPSVFDLTFDNLNQRQVSLLSGKYHVIAKRKHCSDESLAAFSVGKGYPSDYIIKMTTCTE